MRPSLGPGGSPRSRVVALLLMSHATLALCAASPALAQDCTLKKVASITLEATHGAIPVISARLNDSARRFVIDTGSPLSAIDPQVAEELGLTSVPITGVELYTNGKEIDRYARAKSIRLDHTEVTDLTLLLVPPQVLPSGVDGLIGADILSIFDLDFDFGKKTLNLMSPKHCKGNVVYWTDAYTTVPFELSWSRHLFVPVMLDGKRMNALIDTGSARTSIRESSASRAFGLNQDSSGVERIQGMPTDSSLRFRYRFDSLSFEGVTVLHPLIYVHEDVNERTFSRKHRDKEQVDPATRVDLEHADVVVGMNILESLHVYVSYDEQVLYITEAGAH